MSTYKVTLTGEKPASSPNGLSVQCTETHTVEATSSETAQEIVTGLAYADGLTNLKVTEVDCLSGATGNTCIDPFDTNYVTYSSTVSCPTEEDTTVYSPYTVFTSSENTIPSQYTSYSSISSSAESKKIKTLALSYHLPFDNGYYPFYTYRVNLPEGYDI